MYITNITDYDNMTNDYNDTKSKKSNCTINDNIFEKVIPIISITPCGMSIVCLISLMVYTLTKPLSNEKQKYIQL